MKLTMVYDWDKEKKRYGRMTMRLTLPGGFPAKYQAPLLRALDQCLVLEHIRNPPEFETMIVSPDGKNV
jgi:ribosomal protein S12 methylthiotransferase accessory factor